MCSQDDMIDDVESFVMAAEVLKERGAYKIYVLATHGLLSSDAPRLLEDSAIDEVTLHFNPKKGSTVYEIVGCAQEHLLHFLFKIFFVKE